LKKLDSLGKDILSFLEKNEPKMVLWREIKEALYPKYQSHYKNEDSFTVALTNKLTQLRAKGLIKKEGDYYGTFKSSIPEEKEQIKPLEKRRFGFWEWLRHRSEKKRLENERMFGENLPIVESVYNMYRLSWLEPLIKHDKEINKKLDELEKKS
jgi:hypothetical protein